MCIVTTPTFSPRSSYETTTALFRLCHTDTSPTPCWSTMQGMGANITKRKKVANRIGLATLIIFNTPKAV